MSNALDNASRQSPRPEPMPSASPFAALPVSRSAELKCFVSPAPMDSTAGPRRAPASSYATTRTTPAAAERFTTRAKPCRPSGSAAGGNSHTGHVPDTASTRAASPKRASPNCGSPIPRTSTR